MEEKLEQLSVVPQAHPSYYMLHKYWGRNHVGLLHKGGVLLSKDLEEMKCNIQKVQCVFKSAEEEKKAMDALHIIKDERRGSLHTFTVRGNREQVMETLSKSDTIFCEVLPLSLEEIFISETEVVGYDVKKLILG